MSLSDWASPFDSSKVNTKNKTIRNNTARKIDKEKINKLFNTTPKYDPDSDSESELGMSDFNPPPVGEITKSPPDIIVDSNNIDPNNQKEISESVPQFTEDSALVNNSSNNLSHNLSHTFSTFQTDNDLTNKINYLIQLLEDQKHEKTQNITEELILYCFLGVFVIFVIDSFTKAGSRKYVR